MYKTGTLNSEISKVLSDLGHTDTIVIGDCGLPVPKGVQKIDLAVRQGLPSFIDIATLFMDRFKRRNVLIVGAIAMGLSFFALAWAFHFEAGKEGFHLWTFIFIATYISSFCATWGPVMWIMIGEVFPLKIRGLAVGIASLVNWVANWTVSVSFPVLEKSLGDIILFSIFGTFCIIAALFVKYFVFETRGYTLEEIEQALVTNNTKSLN
ncbi:MFS transporter [Macrococcoides caseolyticum]|uniref:Major facilitator superfamily (MFS) profile domain-containing protein n=1 Tax=Macrococcus caseolyticus (strain JCSC5402) TaxID=458233 RepID=B9E9Z6_MACCJ|nr:MFS transporter [Macrococcus caseolyticus]BAH17057.1 hypothetical protein MCCL_0350 [Macrococcus caseolyticus JCSC5402]